MHASCPGRLVFGKKRSAIILPISPDHWRLKARSLVFNPPVACRVTIYSITASVLHGPVVVRAVNIHICKAPLFISNSKPVRGDKLEGILNPLPYIPTGQTSSHNLQYFTQ